MIPTTFLNKYNEYKDLISIQQKEFGLNKQIIATIITIESSWNHKAESPYARGLMQVSKIQLQDINKYQQVKKYGGPYSYDDMFEPQKQIIAGTTYLYHTQNALLKGVEPEILWPCVQMAYNGGATNVRKFLNEDTDFTTQMKRYPKETTDYQFKYIFWFRRWNQKLKEG